MGMKRGRFSAEQIVCILKEHEAGQISQLAPSGSPPTGDLE